MDCGPTCLYMIGKFYGRNLNMQSIVENTEIGKDGVNLLGLSTAAEKIGFRTLSVYSAEAYPTIPRKLSPV